jgi:ethanolamine utilization protein EutA
VHEHDGHVHSHDHDHENAEAHAHPHPHTHDHGSAPGHAHTHEHEHAFDDGDFHEHHGEAPTEEELALLGEALWRLENVELTTVGVDVGSSTSHLMFARVHMQRIADGPSSRFVVAGREDLWRSPILLTPYLSDDTIDAERLGDFIRDAYHEAGLGRDDVDSGAVILTGEALKRRNARAIADLFAEESGKFVCASAGHNLEALMAAHGSGAEALSRRERCVVLNVDVGGGTSKFALIRNGEVLATAAVAVGGRLLVRGPAGGLARIEGPARQVAEAVGVRLADGQPLSNQDEESLCRAWIDVLLSVIHQEAPAGLTKELLLTEPLPTLPRPDVVTFSGGVAEYVYFREGGAHDDFGPTLAAGLHRAIGDGRLGVRVRDPGQGIRATVIGASQFTVQVSGNTIYISDEGRLPIHNLPVLYPRLDLGGEVSPEGVAAEIRAALERFDLKEGENPIALGFRWQGDPYYQRLRALSDGIHRALPRTIDGGLPVVLLFEGDVGKTIGAMLHRDLAVGEVVSVDGMQLKEFDFVDIGEVIYPTLVVPIVIKSLLFADTAAGATVA